MSFHRRQDKIVLSGISKRKCRLLYLVGQLRTGGLERQLCYLLQAMDRQRYSPVVVVWNYKEDDTYVRQIRELGVQVLGLPKTKIGGRVAKLLAFRQMVKDLKPEVIHSYSFYTNFAAYLGGIFTHGVGVGALRSDFTDEFNRSGIVLGRLCARWPNIHISNNMMAANGVKKTRSIFVPKNLFVVRNGLDLKKFRNAALPNFQKVKILAVGSLVPVKRWDRLLTASAALKRNGHDFLVRLVGDGPLRSILAKQSQSLGLSDCVEFLGYRDDIPDLLLDSHFLTHTSDMEGCPNVVIEAMACGRAVIATNVGDVPYLIEDGVTGFVVRRGDDEVLSERIMTLIRDRSLCEQMGAAGRVKAEQQFGLDRLVFEILAAYKSGGWKDY